MIFTIIGKLEVTISSAYKKILYDDYIERHQLQTFHQQDIKMFNSNGILN